MGTRSVITFVEDETVLLSIYRQFDGYLEGRGKQLAEFMENIKLTNGIGARDAGGEAANGMGCLAAQWLANEKANFFEGQINFDKPKESGPGYDEDPWTPADMIGNVYIQAPQEWPDPEDCFIEYFYKVEVEKTPSKEGTMPQQNIILSVCDRKNPGKFEFRGSSENMLKFIEHYMDEDTGDVNENNPYAYDAEEKDMPEIAEELFS